MYSDFVQAARAVFHTQLEQRDISQGAAFMAANDIQQKMVARQQVRIYYSVNYLVLEKLLL